MFEFAFGFTCGILFATKVDCSIFVDGIFLVFKNAVEKAKASQSKESSKLSS